ncbi:enoyl-CoA hydratase/isomerase family protein [Lachnospiraceae bacterium OttesenSCG-928-D06]|nr:enoyl-CoA hydratase/isomerase family protein [Lachnospiraceae bacterium OttesenSCG-928-D06]
MEFQHFLYELVDGVAIFTVNRKEVRNALNAECWEEIGRFVDYVESNDEVRLVIITGAGEKAFVAGADIKALKERSMIDVLGGSAQKVLRKLADCEKPVIAAINGVAFGGGCELALACDIRIAAEHVKMGLPELSLGVIPGAGGTQRLAKLIGLGRAKEMILTGRAVTAQEALQIGLVSMVTPGDNVMTAAKEMAMQILSKGPLAVRLAKKVIAASMSAGEEDGMRLELLSYCVAVASEDRTEGATAFLEKRKPNFKGI